MVEKGSEIPRDYRNQNPKIKRQAALIIIIWANNFYRGENHASTLLFLNFLSRFPINILEER
jgi:hypothetical protein